MKDWPADKVDRVSVKSLVPYAKNARTHSDEQIAQIMASIREWGFTTPILRDEAGMVIAGHGRLLAAMRLGLEDVPVVTATGWTESQKRAYVIADNRLALSAGWDDDLLSGEIGDLDEAGFDLDLLGFDVGEIDDLLAGEDDTDAGADTEPQEDRAEELREQWGVETGQLWQLGEHRILCGDSTKAEDVDLLMGGEKINVCFTSPPYASQRKYDETSGFVPIKPDNYVRWWEPIQKNVKLHLSSDGSFFVNIKEHCEDGQRALYVKDLTLAHARDWGWRFVDEFCWVRSGVPGKWPNRFKNGFEPIFHFCINNDIKFRGESVAHESDDLLRYSPDNIKTHSGFISSGGGANGRIHGMALPNNVLSISTARSDKDRGHTAEFPVDLPSFFIKAFSDSSDVIYEPFSGSGTTIIACENLNRKCRAIEISPAYVAVALQRWADHTGNTPELIDG